MTADKYSALWISYTSLTDFINCPRSYYLKNIYRSEKTGNKIKLMSPPLALGSAIHEVIESLSLLPTDKRFEEALAVRFSTIWKKVSGKQGGFTDKETEAAYKNRGEEMLSYVQKNPGPLVNLAVKINMDLPYFWLSEEDNIILCGKIDWLEYLQDSDSVHIIDFKTSKSNEKDDSLQLPIYKLLVTNCQKRKVEKASYWYLGEKLMVEKKLPNAAESHEKILKIGKKMKAMKQLNLFKCPHNDGCSFCRPYEAVVSGKGEFIGTSSYNQDVYIIDPAHLHQENDSTIL